MIFVIFGLFVVNFAWSVWAVTYGITVPRQKRSKFMEIFSSLGMALGAVLAGSFGSQLAQMIIALS